MPKYKFPQLEHDPRHTYAVVHDELMLDGNARQNLATFCQTWEEPEVHRPMDECIDKNIVDKDEYPQIAEIESRCVHMLSDQWNSPAGDNAVGKPVDKPNLITGPVQVCWHKFTRYWDAWSIGKYPWTRIAC